jgi:hypothetical protein
VGKRCDGGEAAEDTHAWSLIRMLPADLRGVEGAPNQALHLTGATKPAPAGELGRSKQKAYP